MTVAHAPTSSTALAHARPRVIAWLDNHPRSIMLLHAAHRYARERDIDWCVAYVETPSRFLGVESSASQHMLRLCTMAEQMGATILHIQTDNLEKGLRALLDTEKERIACFMVGNDSGKWQGLWRFRRSTWEQVARVASEYSRVEIVPLAGSAFSSFPWRTVSLRQIINPLHLVYAAAAVCVAYLLAILLEAVLPPALFRINTQNISLLFMIACAFSASRYGLLPGLVAAITGSMTYTYFYMAPYHTWQDAGISKTITMVLFISAGLLIALFTSRARSYAESVARRERSTQALFTLYRIASTAFSRQQVLETLQQKLSEMLDMEVAFFLPPTLSPDRIESVVPKDLVLDEVDRRALEAAWTEMKTTGAASPLHTKASWRFEPIVAPGGQIGVLGIRSKAGKPFDMWLGSLLSNITDQTAVLIEHLEMGRSMEATRIREEREKLRSMLLSSVSHDLKTPLAGIIGSLSVYRSVGERLNAERRKELLDSALEEAQRLDSFITNILDMTRLESGKIDFRPEWHDMPSLIQQVAKRTQHRLKDRVLVVHPCPPAIEIYMDAMMTEQVLQNLLDNACKYTPDGTRIEIRCNVDPEQGFLVHVRDHGRGIPEEKLQIVFDKYARLQKEDSQVAGTGLGLAICKAVMEMQNGWIHVANHTEGGTEFTFCLPKWRKISMETHKEEVA